MMSTIADETALWSRARSGDGRAFAAVFDAHRDRAFRHALRLCASAHDAEDVVAGAFFELWRRRDAVPVVDGSVLPWLLVTTTNLARNSGRGLRRYRAAIDRLPRSEERGDPAETAEERIARERLLAAVHALGERDAALLLLTALEGFTPTEAAAALDLSPGAARVRLHRARKRLRERLGADGPLTDTSLPEGAAR
ncbi:RNA polymerase sigma factor [uncultured Amnibacterium sp.]|uniref:RNA polymerase sigma factor n=1 Tax=uncultured Amnibacterium sp. TaxID=1631851 RepID=UPI0035CA6B26